MTSPNRAQMFASHLNHQNQALQMARSPGKSVPLFDLIKDTFHIDSLSEFDGPVKPGNPGKKGVKYVRNRRTRLAAIKHRPKPISYMRHGLMKNRLSLELGLTNHSVDSILKSDTGRGETGWCAVDMETSVVSFDPGDIGGDFGVRCHIKKNDDGAMAPSDVLIFDFINPSLTPFN